MTPRESITDIGEWLAENWQEIIACLLALAVFMVLCGCATHSAPAPVVAALQPAESPVLQSFALAKQVQTFVLLSPQASSAPSTASRPIHWLDANGCTWTAYLGRTNGPFCPQPGKTNLFEVFSHPRNTLFDAPIRVIYSTNLFTWAIFTDWALIGRWATETNYQDEVLLRMNKDLPMMFFKTAYY